MTQTKIERLTHRAFGVDEQGNTYERVLPEEILDVSGAEPKIVKPSNDRVSAPCTHFKSCGGCSLQHASDDFVAAWKTDVVRQGLAAQGIETELRHIVTSPTQSRRRAKFSAKRTKKGAIVGFHGRASGVVLDIPNCQLLDPQLISAIDWFIELTILGASRKGELAITATTSETGLDVLVENAKPLDGVLRIALADVMQRAKFARLVWNDEPVAMESRPLQEFGTAKISLPSGAFLQATSHGEKALISAVDEIVAGSKQIVDLFSGSGTFTLPLAQNAEIHAVEGESEMLEALDRGWREAKGLKRVTTEVRDLFRRPLYPDELKSFQAVVIDPPRAGAQAQTEQIAQSKIEKIAFVSCNPVTFARDAKILADNGFRLEWVQPVDQFRWSSHVELVGNFTRN